MYMAKSGKHELSITLLFPFSEKAKFKLEIPSDLIIHIRGREVENTDPLKSSDFLRNEYG